MVSIFRWTIWYSIWVIHAHRYLQVFNIKIVKRKAPASHLAVNPTEVSIILVPLDALKWIKCTELKHETIKKNYFWLECADFTVGHAG
jgi:hypothetical protein